MEFDARFRHYENPFLTYS